MHPGAKRGHRWHQTALTRTVERNIQRTPTTHKLHPLQMLIQQKPTPPRTTRQKKKHHRNLRVKLENDWNPAGPRKKNGSKSEGLNDERRATEMKINYSEEQQGTHV